jgi:hypothetical protein
LTVKFKCWKFKIFNTLVFLCVFVSFCYLFVDLYAFEIILHVSLHHFALSLSLSLSLFFFSLPYSYVLSGSTRSSVIANKNKKIKCHRLIWYWFVWLASFICCSGVLKHFSWVSFLKVQMSPHKISLDNDSCFCLFFIL